jgi:hypothetical protein
MASYTSLLRFVEPSNGDLAWGGTINNGFTALADAAIAGTATVNVTSSNQTLSSANGAADDARKMVISIIGTPGTARVIEVPSTSKVYFVKNAADAVVTVKVFGQTGVAVPVGASMLLRVNGADVVDAANNFTTLNVGNVPAVTTTGTQSLTNKTFDLSNNTLIATSAQLAAAVTDETGSGALVFASAPTITNGVFTGGTFTNNVFENGTFTNGYTEETVSANTGASYTVDLSNGTVQILTLTDNCTFTFPTPTAGKSFMILLKQDATGSRTATWPATVKWPASVSPILTTTALRLDKFVFTADGTNWYGSNGGQNYTV